jgi:hypothetical protein
MSSEKEMNKAILTILIFCYAICAGVVIQAGAGFAVMKMWQWFITPLGVVGLGFFQAWGICVLLNMLKAKYDPKEFDEDKSVGELFKTVISSQIFGVMLIFITLVSGYILKHLI